MPDRILGLVTPDTAPGTKPSLFFSTVQADLARIWGAAFHVGSTAPAGAQEDDKWYDTVSGQLRRLKSGAWIADLALASRVRLVSPDKGGHHQTLSAALAAITDASPTNRYVILVQGDIAETATVAAKSSVDVVALGRASVTVTINGSGDGFTWTNLSDAHWCGDLLLVRAGTPSGVSAVGRVDGTTDATVTFDGVRFLHAATGVGNCVGLRVRGTAAAVFRRGWARGGGTTNGHGLFITSADSPTAVFEDFDFLGGGSGNSDGAFIQCPTASRFARCRGRGLAGGLGWLVSDSNISLFEDCRGEGPDATASAAWKVEQAAAPTLIRCTARMGLAGSGSIGYGVYDAAAPVLRECVTELARGSLDWAYASANSGRFQPSAAQPYTVAALAVAIVVQQAGGTTLKIGTAAGGSDIAAGIPLDGAAASIQSVVLDQRAADVVAAGGYLYATPSGAVADGAFTLQVGVLYAPTLTNALFINTKGALRVEGGRYVSGAGSDCVSVTTGNTAWRAVGAHFEALQQYTPANKRAAITASPAVSAAQLVRCSLVGHLSGVTPILARRIATLDVVSPWQGAGPLKDVLAPDDWNYVWEQGKANSQATPAWATIIGDSTAQGAVASDFMATAWPALLRGRLLAKAPSWQGDLWTVQYSADWLTAASGSFTGTPPFVVSSTNRTWSSAGFGKLPFYTGGPSNPITFTTPYACTDIDLFYADRIAGTWTYTVDGGAPVTVTCTAAGYVKREQLTGLANTTHAIVLTGQSADNVAALTAAACYLNRSAGVGLARVAWGGAGMRDYVAPVAGSGLTVSPSDLIAAWQGKGAAGTGFGFPTQPHLAVIALGINDCQSDQSGPQQFRWGLQRFVNALRRGRADCAILILAMSIPSTESSELTSGNFTNPNAWHEYVDAMRQCAQSNTCAFANVDARWGQTGVTRGFQTATQPHPSTAGHADIDAFLAPLIT